MENNSITFHVHLPTNIEKLGNPIILGDGPELGEWKKPIVKLHKPYINHPTYWQSEPIDFSNTQILERKYTYAINIPSALLFLEESKIISEGDKRILNNKEKNHYDIWINGNNPDLKKYQIDDKNIEDYVFVDYIFNNIRNHNLKQSILEYKKLLSLYKDLTIKFSDLNYIIKENIKENSFKEQRIFLSLLLGYHISKLNSRQFKLPIDFQSNLLIQSFINYKKIILSDEDHHFINLALLCLIKHNSSQSRLDWLIIFTIIKEFDPNYDFLKDLQNIKFDKKYLENIKFHINNDVELFENKLKIIQWLLKLCQNMDSLFQVWNILLVRNKQITQYFINRIQDIISNNDTITLLYHYSNIPLDFHDRVSFLFRKRILILLKNPDKSWENPNIIALMEFFKFVDLKWNDDDILTCLESISNSHNLLLLESFPKILYDWLLKGFYDKSIPTICRNWIKLLLLKLGIKNTPEEESRHAINIFQLLDNIYPFFYQRIDIWNDLSKIIIDKMKLYSDYCILGATKSMMELKEHDIKRLFIEISKERLNKTVKQVNDQLMNMIIIICGYDIETFKFPLDIPNK